MKTEAEIANKYKILLQRGSTSISNEKVLFAEIRLLEWILKCDECKKYPCVCNEPF